MRSGKPSYAVPRLSVSHLKNISMSHVCKKLQSRQPLSDIKRNVQDEKENFPPQLNVKKNTSCVPACQGSRVCGLNPKNSISTTN